MKNTLPGFVFFFIGLLLSGCAQQSAAPAAPRVPYKVAPRLMAGCLRPAQSLESTAPLAEVQLDVAVSSTGVPTAVSVVKSSGSVRQDALVMQAIRLCEFIPGETDGVRSPGHYPMTYGWTVGEIRNGLKRCLPGDFPKASLALGESGMAVLNILREPNDEMRVQLARSTGHPRLDRETLVHARRCVQHPSVRADFPVGRAVSQSMAWTLSD